MSEALLAIIKNGKIELVDKLNIPEGTRVLVTPIPSTNLDEDRSEWEHVSLQGLSKCYGDDEPEYGLELVKEMNPEYEGS